MCLWWMDALNLLDQWFKTRKHSYRKGFHLAPSSFTGKGQEVPILLPIFERAGSDNQKRIGSTETVTAIPDQSANDIFSPGPPCPKAPGTRSGRGESFRSPSLISNFNPIREPFDQGMVLARSKIVLRCRMFSESRPMPILVRCYLLHQDFTIFPGACPGRRPFPTRS